MISLFLCAVFNLVRQRCNDKKLPCCNKKRNSNIHVKKCYRNDPKFSDKQVWANSADPDQTALEEQSDQGLHCLLFHLHLFDEIH